MNTINNYSNINFFCKAFVQAAPPVNKTIAIIAAIALACIATAFAVWYWGCRHLINDPDPHGFEKRKQERVAKEGKEKIDKINSDPTKENPLLLIDFLDLAKTRGAEITCFNFAHATNEEIKEVIRLCPNLTSLKVRSDKVDHKGLSDLGLLTKLEVPRLEFLSGW